MNREFASFPFRPYLAKYLFYSCRNEVIETEDAHLRHLDIDLNSPDGQFLRILFTRADFPNIKEAKKGFRLTIRIPKRTTQYEKFTEDGRSAPLVITDEAANIINDHYENRFRDGFISFVRGYIRGAEQKRGALKSAIIEFMKAYDINKGDGWTYESMRKFFQRSNSPLKIGIYAKK